MEKLSHTTESIIDENVERLAELFPEVVTEVREPDGTLRHTIDVDALKERVGDVAEGQRERYQFTWPGKREAKQEAYRQIDKCLRPCPEESVNWDTTQNLYIEGDNLDALKLLRNTYAGKIKMIYIDPPYNTGHDFIYDDHFARTAEEEAEASGAFDDEGNVLDSAYKQNNESNGRFHSDWCSMMYPRLLLARDLLSEDGVLFISIDDAEQADIAKICNECFGMQNHIASLIWQKKYTRANDARFFSATHDFILCYSKSSDRCVIGKLPRSEEMNRAYKNPDNDPRGPWKATPLHARSGKAGGDFQYTFSNGYVWSPPSGTYPRYSVAKLKELDESGEIWFGRNGDAVPSRKTYLTSLWNDGVVPTTIISYKEGGDNHRAVEEVKELFEGKNLFSSPKPTELLRMLQCFANLATDSVVLDFFSGSATTAHAVMQFNAEDGGSRKFIMVQLPEVCDEKSEAAKAGYKNICEIGKERIRRAGKKIATEVEETNRRLKLSEEPKNIPDVGFRVLKIDSSNFEDISAEPAVYTQQMLAGLADNLKLGRTADDLIIQVMLKKQIELSAPIERLDVDGHTVFSVDGGRLVACFDRDVPVEVMTAMAKMEPDYAVMRDASFAGDDAVSNFAEIFKNYSSVTEVEVI